MAKDAKGHGSEKRGGSTFDRLNADRKAQGYAPMSENRRGVHDFLDYMDGTGPKPDAMVAAELGQGHPKSGASPVHPGAAGGLARGLSVDWKNAPNPYTGGSLAAQSRARRKDKAAAYVAAREVRPSNFKLK